MRWPLLRKGSRVRGKARKKLNALIASKVDTARAWELKEAFLHLWTYKSPLWAAGFLDAWFLDAWCDRALRSRLEPMQKVARMLRHHEELLMNWFRAKGELSSAAGAFHPAYCKAFHICSGHTHTPAFVRVSLDEDRPPSRRPPAGRVVPAPQVPQTLRSREQASKIPS